jgi:hypothetical protein
LKNGLSLSSDKGALGPFSLTKAVIMGLIVLWGDEPFFVSLAPMRMPDKSFGRLNVHECKVIIESISSENLPGVSLRHSA